MKKTVIKGIVFTVTFFAALIIISVIFNKGNTDMTGEMKAAEFPLMYMVADNERLNCLHGYREKLESSNLRDTLTPLGEDRGLSFVLEKYGNDIESISFEVRSPDGLRLIENTQITNYEEDKETIRGQLTVKDLIEDNEEYKLIFLVETKDNKTISYYTRIVKGTDYHAAEKIKFVRDFHERTFDKEAARQITKYLESDARGDNSTYNKVNIHSSFNQITWGNLKVEKVGAENLSVREMGTQTASFQVTYCVSIKEGRKKNYYMAEEYYRIRYTADRIYLLDFERTMDQIVDENGDIFASNKIFLGITDKDIAVQESDGGNVFAFVATDRLYSYNVTDNKFALLFGFYNAENADPRTMYDAHDIKILNVDETGNVLFMVYGYMNRGRYEGRVGVQVLRYSSVSNTVEEEIFLPYQGSYDVLQADVEKISYVNKSNVLYLMLKGSIYAVDLETKQSSVIVSDLSEDSFRVSESNKMVVWQEVQNGGESTTLCQMNLNTGNRQRISADYGRYIAPLGYMGEDLIYGEAKKEEVVKDSSGRTVFPMKAVKIQSENGEVLKTYAQEGIYVTDCSIEDNQITLNRVKRDEETGLYTDISDDQIMNSRVVEKGVNVIETAVTENYETVVQIAVKSKINSRFVKRLAPKEVLFEESREVALEEGTNKITRYYVYGKDGVEGVYTEPASAINLADEIAGVVTNDRGNYIWKKGNLSVKNQIMAIRENTVTEEKDSLAVCLDTMLRYEGILRNTEIMLNNGGTAMSVLKGQMPDAAILDLTGCSLNSILYYVNLDIPVLALLEEKEAVLIIGFNELNTVLMDPLTGTIYKKGMNDSKKMFEENGNRFITYIRQK